MPFIADMDRNAPDGQVDRGFVVDDQIRSVKADVQDTLPNMNAPVTITPTEANHLSGVMANVQAQIDAIAANIINNPIEVFMTLSSAPTGWSRLTTLNDRYLRVMSTDTPGDTGGSYTITGLSMPHTHSGTTGAPNEGDENTGFGTGSSARQAHGHNFTTGQPSTNVVTHTPGWRLTYVNVALYQKNTFTIP